MYSANTYDVHEMLTRFLSILYNHISWIDKEMIVEEKEKKWNEIKGNEMKWKEMTWKEHTSSTFTHSWLLYSFAKSNAVLPPCNDDDEKENQKDSFLRSVFHIYLKIFLTLFLFVSSAPHSNSFSTNLEWPFLDASMRGV